MVDADPVHLASARDLFLADDRNVVLRDAGNRARAAPGAGREVDRHPPLVAVVGVIGVERERLRRCVTLVRDHRRVVLVFLERRDAHRGAAFHHVMFLRRRQQIPLTGL